jgi:membrane protein DedA with SNARE-associated domain
MHYLVLFTVVLLVGIIPAFGPPSWIFAVYFRQQHHLSFVAVILVTALATTLGRLVLARLTRLLKPYIPKRFISNLDYSKRLLNKKQKSVWLIIGLFVLSPLPSAQLFEAAGLMEIPLVPLGVAFFGGRILSLSIYVSIAKLTSFNLHKAWEAGFTSPWAFALELLCIIAVVALLNLRWITLKIQKIKAQNKT